MRSLSLVAAIFFLFSPALVAQSGSITGTQIGDFTFYNGQIDGQSVSGTTQSIGNFDYTNLRVGNQYLSGTETRIGNFEYGSWMDYSGPDLDYSGTSYDPSYDPLIEPW